MQPLRIALIKYMTPSADAKDEIEAAGERGPGGVPRPPEAAKILEATVKFR